MIDTISKWRGIAGGTIAALIAATVLSVTLPRHEDRPATTAFHFSDSRSQAEQIAQAVWLVMVDGAQGSAVAIRHKGKNLLLTAAHVVDTYTTVRLARPLRGNSFLSGRVELSARVIRANHKSDYAILKVDDAPDGLFDGAVALDDQDFPPIGTELFLVGNIFGSYFPLSVSRGIVAAHAVEIDHPGWHWAGQPLDQTDATGYPGVSGGGVFIDGQLAGVVVGMSAPNVLFYVPIRSIKGEFYGL